MEPMSCQQTIRRQIVDDGKVKSLIDVIHSMPDRIKDAKDVQAKLDFELSVDNTVKLAQEEVTRIESELAFEINLELDDNGKKKFSNEAQRTQAIKVKCSQSDEWKAAVEDLGRASRKASEAKWGLAKAHNTLSHLYEQQRAILAIAYLIGGLSREDDAKEHLNVITRQAEVLNDIGKAVNSLNRIEVQ